MFTSAGILRCSPTLNGSLERRDGGTTKWWIILECDPEIGRYYRHLFYIGCYWIEKLSPPLWQTHISVVRDEVPTDEKLFYGFEGKSARFQYSHVVKTDSVYAWLSVESEALRQLRMDLGFSADPYVPFHMTIGNLKGI